MVATTTTIRHRQPHRKNHLKTRKLSAASIEHAVRIIHAICGLAGSVSLIDDIRADLRAEKVHAAIRNHDTAVVFDWLRNTERGASVGNFALLLFKARTD